MTALTTHQGLISQVLQLPQAQAQRQQAAQAQGRNNPNPGA